MNRPQWRRVILFSALVVSLAAVFWMRASEEAGSPEVAAPISRTQREMATSVESASTPALALSRLGRRTPQDIETDPFIAKSWYVPSPAPAPPAPEKLTAPPLAFQFSGKFEEADGGRLVVYLIKGNETFAVSPGDTFDKNYRFESMDRGQMVIVYLPLSSKQYLPTGVPE